MKGNKMPNKPYGSLKGAPDRDSAGGNKIIKGTDLRTKGSK